MEQIPEIKIDTVKATGRKATSSVKSAGSLVAKKAEDTKIATVTLPRAYNELGKAIYTDGSRRQNYEHLFATIDGLLRDRQLCKDQAEARPPAETLAEKAKQVAADATALAKNKATDLQLFKAFATLGEAHFQSHGNGGGPAELVEPIAHAVARRNQLRSEMSSLQQGYKGQWITPKRVIWAAGILLALSGLGTLVGEGKVRDNGKSSGAKQSGPSGASSPRGNGDSELKSLAAAAFENALAGMTPEQLQSVFRATASKDRRKWGGFTKIKPARTKEVKIEPDVVYGFPTLRQWYDKSDVIECKFVKNIVSNKWELQAAWIGDNQVQLGAKPKCKAYCYDIQYKGRTSNVILQVPVTGDPSKDSGQLAYDMLKASVSGEFKILDHGVIGR